MWMPSTPFRNGEAARLKVRARPAPLFSRIRTSDESLAVMLDKGVEVMWVVEFRVDGRCSEMCGTWFLYMHMTGHCTEHF